MDAGRVAVDVGIALGTAGQGVADHGVVGADGDAVDGRSRVADGDGVGRDGRAVVVAVVGCDGAGHVVVAVDLVQEHVGGVVLVVQFQQLTGEIALDREQWMGVEQQGLVRGHSVDDVGAMACDGRRHRGEGHPRWMEIEREGARLDLHRLVGRAIAHGDLHVGHALAALVDAVAALIACGRVLERVGIVLHRGG